MIAAVTMTRLEKAATDNGFDLELARTADWLCFGSTQTSLHIWLTAIGPSQFAAAMSRSDVLDGLAGLGLAFTNPLPSGAAGALNVSGVDATSIASCAAHSSSPGRSRTRSSAPSENETAHLPRTNGSRAPGGAAGRP